MKNGLIIALSLVLIMLTLNGFAQDYMKWGIPENATLRLGKGRIYDLKHSPNGDLIAVASSIGVWIYDADSGKEIRLLQKHSDWVSSLAFSPNGKMLASCGPDGIHLWDSHTGQYLSTLIQTEHTEHLVFFPDGRTLVSTSDRIIRFWDVANRTISKTLTGHTWRILSLAVSPNGKTVVSGSHVGGSQQKSNGLRWWDVETGRTMFFSKNAGTVTALAFSPDGKILACADSSLTSGTNPVIYLFDCNNGEILKTLRGYKATIKALTFSPNGEILASCGYDDTIRLWEPHSGRHLYTFRGHTDGVKTLSFSPDNKTLVSGGEDGTIRFWDTSTKQQRLSISGHWLGDVDALAFSTDGKTLVSGIPHATIHKWDISTGQLKSTLTGNYGERILAFDINRDLFASRSSYLEKNDKIYIRHIDTGKSRSSMEIDKFSYKEKATFSHDGGTLVLTDLGIGEKGGRAKVKFWETFSQRLKFDFVPNENPEVSKRYPNDDRVTALASSPDSTLLAIATGKITQRVSIWKFGTNEFIRLCPAGYGFLMCDALAFSNDSKTLAIGDSWDIRLIEVDTGHLITTLSKHNRGVRALAFSPNGKILASGSQDGTILIWDLDKVMKSR